LFQDRDYQIDCGKALFNSVIESPNNNPIGAIPTSAGKTVVICILIDLFLTAFPRKDVLILSHVGEILKQDYDSYRRYFEWDDDVDDFMDFTQVGLYSAGLGCREVKKTTVAGIQSVYDKPELFENVGLVIIDECHLVTIDEKGMYRKLLKILGVNCVGVTATPFRTGHGYLHKGEGSLFNCLAYDLTSRKNYNRLVSQGWIGKIISKRTSLRLSTKGVRLIAGEFSQKGLSKVNDRDEITTAAIIETIFFGKNYKRWLFFAIDIAHAENIVRILKENDVSAICIHSKMEGNRKQIIEDCKNGKYRAVVNIDILVTGHNDPLIDLIVLLRPTNSLIVHIQAPGRGGRVVYAPGYPIDTVKQRLKAIKKGPKKHCLVLDFAGNLPRLGPINDPKVEAPGKKKKGGGGAMTKDCPECKTENHLSAKECVFCGEEFPRTEKIKAVADSTSEIVRLKRKSIIKKAKDAVNWYKVKHINFDIEYGMFGFPDKFLVTYICKDKTFSETVALNNPNGYPKYYAWAWVKLHWIPKPGAVKPTRVSHLMLQDGNLRLPRKILVDSSGRYDKFINKKF